MGTTGVTTTSQELKIIGIVVVVLIIAVVCAFGIAPWLGKRISTRPTPTAANVQQLIQSSQPQVLILTQTPTPSHIQSSQLTLTPNNSLRLGSYWYAYECDAGIPSKCMFVPQGGTTGLWAECIEPNKYRPTYYLADPYGLTWYQLEADRRLHPINKKGNYQSFQFVSQGGGQQK